VLLVTSNWVPDRQRLPYPHIVESSVDGNVGLIEMTEPERMNPQGLNEIHITYCLQEMQIDVDVRAVILTGRGRAFCAGGDIHPPNGDGGMDDQGWSNPQRLAYKFAFGNMWETLQNFSKPLIAAVNGYCLGGGWELAHMCDMIVASDDAVFGAVEIDSGLIPQATGCEYLTKMVGYHRAMELTLTGRKIKADEALALGLVNRVVPRDELMKAARALADEIASRPPITVAAIRQLNKKALNRMENYELERAWGYYLRTTSDQHAAREALAKKQARPQFQAE
jgi:enoyl-CoA hydratase